MSLSQRVQKVKPSPTLAVFAKAAELRRAGKDIISLGVGEPDFDTPDHIKQAAIVALQNGATKYTPVDGIPELKQAICDKLKRDNALQYESGQVLVSCGAKHTLYNIMQAVLDPGDEVIIPAPYWVSYPDMVLLADAKPVIVTADIENKLKITADELAAAITDNTKMIILNSPSNPTGIAYTASELQALADVVKQHPNILVVSDDIYEPMYWNAEPFSNILMCAPDLYERTIVVNGVSKSYAMTGWRIGYAAGPANIIDAMKKIQSQSTSCPAAVSQAAAVAALNGDQHCVIEMRDAFKVRHDKVVAVLNDMAGVRCVPADGTFYCFPSIEQAIAKLDGINNDIEFAKQLLEKTGVALVPGSAFGKPGYFRLSFATDMSELEDALNRIGNFLV